MKAIFTLFAALALCFSTQLALAQLHVDVESGAVINGYNDVQVPGTSEGTRISLTDNFKQDNYNYFRARMGYIIKDHHDIYVTLAPLKLFSTGSTANNINFGGKEYMANTNIAAMYQFNTYRLTYRYLFLPNERITIGVGLTGLLRQAEIRLQQGATTANSTDLGVVPLLNVYFAGEIVPDKLTFLLDVDALVGPSGRAEDGFAGLRYNPLASVGIYAGYRIIEGGADIDQVYNFSLLHFASAGLSIRL